MTAPRVYMHTRLTREKPTTRPCDRAYRRGRRSWVTQLHRKWDE
ncbi:MAG: hypothetical protein QOE36_2770 [Gaiellaceae bacterium]|jgi:hypothetical protein|nr:hypothetical protein [Gaiellaceae bacterium]